MGAKPTSRSPARTSEFGPKADRRQRLRTKTGFDSSAPCSTAPQAARAVERNFGESYLQSLGRAYARSGRDLPRHRGEDKTTCARAWLAEDRRAVFRRAWRTKAIISRSPDGEAEWPDSRGPAAEVDAGQNETGSSQCGGRQLYLSRYWQRKCFS